MATFFMFGKYSAEAIKAISIERTQQAVDEIKKLGGEMTAMHALMGAYDLLFCVKMASVDDAMRASVALSRLTGISLTTCPAVSIEIFDRLVDSP